LLRNSDSRKSGKEQTVAVALKARMAENSSLEVNYYRGTVKVVSFLVFISTFFLILLFFRVMASLFVVLDYSFQLFKKKRFPETKRNKIEPVSSTGHERRKCPRFNVYWPIEYNQMGSSISHNGRVTNLSETGMLIQSPGQVEIGQHLASKLSFILGSEISTIDMQAEVVWRDNHLNKAKGDYRCGTRFVDISTTDKMKLENLLMTLSRQSPYSS
jgi:PilZ domain